MTNGSKEEYEEYRLPQKIFLLNSVIRDKTISDNGILVYCYLKAIQRVDVNYYPMSVELMDYFFRHTFDIETRDKKKYVDGLNDLEEHNLIKKISEKKFNFEYDLQKIYFDPTKSNKENEQFFTVVYSDELCSIMQIEDDNFSGSKAKLVRYFVNVVSTFMKGKRWTFDLLNDTKKDGIVGFSSIQHLSDISNINKDTIVTYNKILEKEKLLYIYRANELILRSDRTLDGITNTYGRYRYKKLIKSKGEQHKSEYGYDKEKDNVKFKTKKTAERKSLGAKYYYLLEGQDYDEQTIIEIYRYAVEYNKRHEGDSFYKDKLKDLEFFEQFPFITEDCLKENPKPKREFPIDNDNWGVPNSMETDFSVEEMLDMPTLNNVEINDSG